MLTVDGSGLPNEPVRVRKRAMFPYVTSKLCMIIKLASFDVHCKLSLTVKQAVYKSDYIQVT
jgi:hypothetical protein